MSYLPFTIVQTSNDQYINDFQYAATKVVNDSNLNRVFHFFMDKRYDEKISLLEVKEFLEDLYSIRDPRDVKRSLDLLTYDSTSKNLCFKLKDAYFDKACEMFFTDMVNYTTMREKLSSYSGLKFISNDRKDSITLKIGNGSTVKGNEGINYENDFLADCENYIKGADTVDATIKDILTVISDDRPLLGAAKTSTSDTKRFKNFGTTLDKNIAAIDCGSQISDVTLTYDNNSKEYLSLKAKNGDRLANIGIGSIIKFNSPILSDSTIKFLEKFKFDAAKIKDILENEYDPNHGNKTGEGETIDLLNNYNNSIVNDIADDYENYKEFIISFISYCLGYGYWYVKEGKSIPIKIDETIISNFKDFLENKIKNIVVEYPKATSKTTQLRLRADSEDANSSKDILIQFKNTNKGLYPNKLMLIYYHLYEDLLSLADAPTVVADSEEFTFDDDILFS